MTKVVFSKNYNCKLQCEVCDTGDLDKALKQKRAKEQPVDEIVSISTMEYCRPCEN